MRILFWIFLISFTILRVITSGPTKITANFPEDTNPLKEKISFFYKKTLPEPHASLLSGMVLGTKTGLPYNFWQSLKITGTAHVVVASGMNVSLLAGFLLGFLALFFKRKTAIPILLTAIWGYVFLVGFEAPIVRAGIMGSLAFAGQALGRVVSVWRILALTVLVMLAVKPVWAFELGFILSFLATTSLMLFESRIRTYIKVFPEVVKEGLSTSLAAQVGVAPILFVTFGQFNPLSPVINALILWTVPLITIIGALAGIIGMAVPFLGSLVLYLCYPLTSWFIWVVTNLS